MPPSLRGFELETVDEGAARWVFLQAMQGGPSNGYGIEVPRA